MEAKEVPIIGVVTGGMSVAPLDESTSEITLDMTYNIGLGIVGKVINVVLLRMVFKHVLNRVLKGLQHHMETGQLIGKGGRSTPPHNLR